MLSVAQGKGKAQSGMAHNITGSFSYLKGTMINNLNNLTSVYLRDTEIIPPKLTFICVTSIHHEVWLFYSQFITSLLLKRITVRHTKYMAWSDNVRPQNSESHLRWDLMDSSFTKTGRTAEGMFLIQEC